MGDAGASSIKSGGRRGVEAVHAGVRYWLVRFAGGAVAADLARPVEDGEGSVEILADLDLGLDEVRPQRAGRDLQPVAMEDDGVVVADPARLLDAENLAQLGFVDGNEGAARLLCRHGEAGVPAGEETIFEKAIGGLDAVDAGQRQFLRQPVLQRPEGAFGAAAGLRRERCDVLDAELCQRPADLGACPRVGLLAGLGGREVVAAAVGERPWRANTASRARKVETVPSSATRIAE